MIDLTAALNLRDAPEAFFDEIEWRAFVAFHRDRNAALQRMSEEEPGGIGHMRFLLAGDRTFGGLRAREEEQIVQIGRSLVFQFVLGLREGRVLASGFTSFQIDRAVIPAERWADLKPDFVKGRAKAGEGGLSFENVLVWTPPETSVDGGVEEDALRGFLRKRQQEGVRLKNVLQHEVSVEFPKLTTRAFSAAYKEVFETARGRPKTQR